MDFIPWGDDMVSENRGFSINKLLCIASMLALCFIFDASCHAGVYRYSVSLFHFNIEYVAGGGEYYENIIIEESFGLSLRFMTCYCSKAHSCHI